jgi:hypothetical protein
MRTKPLAKNPPAPREPEKPQSPGSSRASSLAAAAAACVVGIAGGSCTSSEPAVRPGPPERQLCPPGSVETMREEFGINSEQYGYAHMADLFAMPGYDVPTPAKMKFEHSVPITEGRHEVRLVSLQGPKGVGLPKKSVLVGDFFIRDRLYARFNEARLPDGRRLPFCGELIDPGSYKRGVALIPDSKPGTWRVRALVGVGSSDVTY